jgi:hypothetical protein
MRFLNSAATTFATTLLLMGCAAGAGTDDAGDGDGTAGDGDTNLGDGDTNLGDGDTVQLGDGDAAVGDGDLGTGAGATTASGGMAGTGSATSTGGATGTGGATSTGGAASTGGSTSVTCIPGAGVEDVGVDSFLDKATCLTWQKADTHVGTITNRGALVHCASLSQDGQVWRLPTAQELKTYPNLPDSGNAYLAGPTYIPTTASDEATGCTDNSHSCNLTQYSAGNFDCGWQGPGAGAYPVLCVSGSPAAGTLDAAFEVATCCTGSSTYKEADCSPY